MRRFTVPVLAFAAAGVLTACGGGGSGPGITAGELEELRSDPRVVRLAGIMETADTLLIPSTHIWSSFTAQGETIIDREEEGYSCIGSRCVGNSSGEVISLDDFANPGTSADVIVTKASLGSQAGFDTMAYRAGIPVSSAENDDIAISGDLSADFYGAWGRHGAAILAVADAPFTGSYRGIPFTGDLRQAVPHVAGSAAGTNPAGTGSARWTGVAEAASTLNFQRRQGTVMLTIADLSRPRVGVDIDIGGHDIGAPGWSDIPVTGGNFETGTIGRDYVEGNFHGADHSEAYGVFDTGPYVGAFGARQAQ